MPGPAPDMKRIASLFGKRLNQFHCSVLSIIGKEVNGAPAGTQETPVDS
jgi:hypothetical protein